MLVAMHLDRSNRLRVQVMGAGGDGHYPPKHAREVRLPLTCPHPVYCLFHLMDTSQLCTQGMNLMPEHRDIEIQQQSFAQPNRRARKSEHARVHQELPSEVGVVLY